MTTSRPLSLILAVADNGVIGRNNALPWHIPAELKYFKSVTLGKPLLMGRKTFESLGRPLPGRLNLVISRQPGLTFDGAETFSSLDAAIDRAQAWAEEHGAEELMVIGGAQLYAETLQRAGRMYLTRIALEPEGDAFFPAWNPDEWRLVSRIEHPEQGELPAYGCEVWERR